MPRKSAARSAWFSAVLLASLVSVSAAATPQIPRSEPSVWAETWGRLLRIFGLPCPVAGVEHSAPSLGLMVDPNGRTPEPPPGTATGTPEAAEDDLE